MFLKFAPITRIGPWHRTMFVKSFGCLPVCYRTVMMTVLENTRGKTSQGKADHALASENPGRRHRASAHPDAQSSCHIGPSTISGETVVRKIFLSYLTRQRRNRRAWQVAILAFSLVLIHQIVAHTWLANLSPGEHLASQVFFYGIIGPAVAWWGLTALQRQIDVTETAKRRLEGAQAEVTAANQRLEFLYQVSRRLTEAEDEEGLIDVILDLPLEVVPAVGCSLIRFDDNGRPMPARHRGSLEPTLFDAWGMHLSGADNSHPCENCSATRTTVSVPCPLGSPSPTTAAVGQVHCLGLARGGREYGLLNIYLGQSKSLDAREQTLLGVMSNEISLALESQHLRSRELSMLLHLQRVRRQNTLRGELSELLYHTVTALEIAGGALFVADSAASEVESLAQVGQPQQATWELVEGVVSGAQEAQAPLIINDLQQEHGVDAGLRSLLLVPLGIKEQTRGSLVLWATQPDVFTRRRVRLVNVLAGQLSLLVENHRLYAHAEHKATLAERARLAREIHDGLAQTLGYLKLRAAQITRWLDDGQIERVGDGLKELRGLLAETYVDTREAIDGLRLKPGGGRLDAWLDQALVDFSNLTGIRIKTAPAPEWSLSPEAQAQLLRVVQEALNNIRKHAAATQVTLDWDATPFGLTLRIADDGCGFDAADVPPMSQHGLNIMRERAELLDADLQIISQPGAGTQVLLRLPPLDPKGFPKPLGSTARET
jgi:two-component system nitrate/nitrite sensor histidine kinase NarX